MLVCGCIYVWLRFFFVWYIVWVFRRVSRRWRRDILSLLINFNLAIRTEGRGAVTKHRVIRNKIDNGISGTASRNFADPSIYMRRWWRICRYYSVYLYMSVENIYPWFRYSILCIAFALRIIMCGIMKIEPKIVGSKCYWFYGVLRNPISSLWLCGSGGFLNSPPKLVFV